ncbi:MAG: hypothetical protein ACT4PV_07655 [Planctomycetaceae bacterium]
MHNWLRSRRPPKEARAPQWVGRLDEEQRRRLAENLKRILEPKQFLPRPPSAAN